MFERGLAIFAFIMLFGFVAILVIKLERQISQ